MHGHRESDERSDECAKCGSTPNHHWRDEAFPRVMLLIGNEPKGATDERPEECTVAGVNSSATCGAMPRRG